MLKIGKYNTLKVVKFVDFGAYLEGGKNIEILMPARYVPDDCQIGDWVDVFVYPDSEDRPVATTEKPKAQVGEFACLQVISLNEVGAFLDWGLLKDLLVPFREQKARMVEGRWYIVYVYLDEKTNRIVASAKIDKFLDLFESDFEEGDEVDLLIAQHTDLGYKAIVNDTFWGILYENEVFEELIPGQRRKGYIQRVREDGKLDLMLHKAGYEKIGEIAELILQKIKENEGFVPITDKSPAEEIYKTFGISKKTYKKAIGELYKKRIVALEEKGVRTTDEPRFL
jgi:uncharacterized protein